MEKVKICYQANGGHLFRVPFEKILNLLKYIIERANLSFQKLDIFKNDRVISISKLSLKKKHPVTEFQKEFREKE